MVKRTLHHRQGDQYRSVLRSTLSVIGPVVYAVIHVAPAHVDEYIAPTGSVCCGDVRAVWKLCEYMVNTLTCVHGCVFGGDPVVVEFRRQR